MTPSSPTAPNDQLETAIRSAFADIVDATDRAQLLARSHELAPHPDRPSATRWLAVAAVALLLAGVGSLLLTSRRDESADRDLVGAPGPTEPPSAADPARDEITWQRADDVGSIERSAVDSIVANSHGFVAIGMGFDDGRNQGRVWHSPDGVTWAEPAFDMFDAKTVLGATASDDAFYVLAATNADRTPDQEGEGTVHLPDVQIYRSTDGIEWSPWGEPNVATMNIAAAGDVVLRQTQTEADRIEWSTDGEAWSASEFPEGDDVVLLGLGMLVSDADPTLIDSGVIYLPGFVGDVSDDGFVIWASTDHGRSWHRLPAPPTGGAVVDVPGGVIVGYNPDEEVCMQGDDGTTEGSQSKDPIARDRALTDSSWTCAAHLRMLRYDTAANTWTSIAAVGPGPTPRMTPMRRVGNTLVIPILEPGKALTVWTASLDATDWEADPTTTLAFGNDAGTPSTVAVAASDDRIVIASPDRLVDGKTVLLVGTAG